MVGSELALWGLSVVFYGLGDWVTTVWPSEEIEERTPLIRAAFGPRPGAVPFGIFKILLLAGVYLLYSVLPPRKVGSFEVRLFIPVACTVVGAVATANNLYHLLTERADR